MKYCIGDLEEVGMFDLMQRKNNGNPANRVILPHHTFHHTFRYDTVEVENGL